MCRGDTEEDSGGKSVRNCIIKGWKEDIGDCYWNGVGWFTDRMKAKRYSLPCVEGVVENMRKDDEMVFWERFDTSRSSL
jgi:hypothetical protein